MKYEYLSNTPLPEAIGKLSASLDAAGFNYKTEKIRVTQANGRVLARAHYAQRS